jgi:hypothetical protein
VKLQIPLSGPCVRGSLRWTYSLSQNILNYVVMGASFSSDLVQKALTNFSISDAKQDFSMADRN